MKGMVFTEYIDFVTDTFGVEVCESMIDACTLTDDGAYTAVGTYDHKELVAMVVQLSEATKTPPSDLVKAYGSHLFGVLASKYASMIEGMTNSFDLLKQIGGLRDPEVNRVASVFSPRFCPSFTEPPFIAGTAISVNRRCSVLWAPAASVSFSTSPSISSCGRKLP